jgi:nucleoside-diphosphate-sugar epimerase
MTQPKLALILGATGGIGSELARRLHESGWTVRALHRDPASLKGRNEAYEWVRGDAMVQADVVAAAQGAALIVHGVNPPGYRNWGTLVLPMIDNTIAAARASGARIVLPGTIYNFGPDAWPELTEDSPQHPDTRKGRIRAEMEARLRGASRDGVKTLIVRAGDFFGPGAANNWFSQGLVTPGQPVTRILSPGRRGVGHEWAYLPDVAETMLQLVERETDLESFAVFHMQGHWDADGTQITGAIRRVTTAAASVAASKESPARSVAREPRVWPFPWFVVTLASPFVALFAEMREMRYLWREPLRMRNSRLVRFLGEEPHTPLDDAVHTTLVGLGCLAPSAVGAGRTLKSLAY